MLQTFFHLDNKTFLHQESTQVTDGTTVKASTPLSDVDREPAISLVNRSVDCILSLIKDAAISNAAPEMLMFLPETLVLPETSDSDPAGVLMLAQMNNPLEGSRFPANGHWNFHGLRIPPVTIVFAFAGLSLIFIFRILYSVMTIYQEKAKGYMQSHEQRYPESAAWERSKIDWLWMGWATEWISRWGTAENSALTKISPEDIPMSSPEDECDLCFAQFKKIWLEELERVGKANASLLKVVTRFVTYRKVFAIGFWNAFYEGFMYLGPPMAIKWVTKYINWLYTQRGLGVTIAGEALVMPSITLIVIFLGLPMLMAVSNSMCTMLNGRLSIRIDGALSMAVYDKAQRLPVVQDDADDIELLVGAGTKKLGHNQDESKSPEDEAFDNEPPLEAEKIYANGGISKRFNLVQVVTTDINTNLMAIPNSIARMIVMVPVMLVTMCMLVAEIGWAFTFSVAVALANLGIMTVVVFAMRNSLALFYTVAGRRLQFLQESMVGIRFIKGCGAEHIVREKLTLARDLEIGSLRNYYSIQFFMHVLALQLPKLYTLTSLGGYALIHRGDVEPTVIMAILPLLMSVQGAIGVVFTLIPELVMALPSCKRLETFLKLKEAPRAFERNRDGSIKSMPQHIRFTPDNKEPVLRLQGSFAWQSWAKPTVKNVDLVIPHGKLVGVLGAVGSGKSTLLHAILGEMHPVGDARIEVQKRIAYSSQSPHLFEGSLRDNVLKGDPMDARRYEEAIHAACLQQDLEQLPGGDEVPVGGRGITLSGGQKARVSLSRAAYDKSDLVLIDDPFAAVDVQTGRHINEHLLHGPLMKGRTRIVVTQPDTERLSRFDWVVIMVDGQVRRQGHPSGMVETAEYQSILSSVVQGKCAEEEAVAPQNQRTQELILNDGYELREEECQGRASWGTISYFARTGGIGIAFCITLFLFKEVLDMKTTVQLSIWMTHGSQYDAGLTSVKPRPSFYLLNYLYGVIASTIVYMFCWIGGQSWTLKVSEGAHNNIIKSLMRAPMDRFYDKTPVGRIMNRMANDMMSIDMDVMIGCCSTIGQVWALCVPIYYVHLTMPLWFTVLSIPMYYLVLTLIALYWKTMVPLRYLMQVSKSGVSSEIADVEATPASVRAYNMEEYRLHVFGIAVRKMIAADFLGGIVCIRWVCNRLFVLGGIFTAGMSLLCIWTPGLIDVGSASLVINTMFQIVVSIECSLHTGSRAQHQIIACNRIYEYSSLPEEHEEVLASDKPFQSVMVNVRRRALGDLQYEVKDGLMTVFRQHNDFKEPLLVQARNKTHLLPAEGALLTDLAPTCTELRGTNGRHRIVSINGIDGVHGVRSMVQELTDGDSLDVVMRCISGWLADGVKVEIEDLTTGYADIKTNVLKGVSITIPRGNKAGICGPTGCGKSTLLLSLLRMLEPRSGRILLEGVDTSTLGLRTLRTSLGLVPQDPVLLTGSLRFNIDPFEMYPDERIWEALKLVHMAEYVYYLPGRLDFGVAGEGSNLSFGQRQLLSLARNIVREPMLLLLDEATSAIDPRTQELLQDTITKAFSEATMIVIAHRLETILYFDMAVVMDRGRVAEMGSIKELAQKKDGRFAHMLAVKGLSVPL